MSLHYVTYDNTISGMGDRPLLRALSVSDASLATSNLASNESLIETAEFIDPQLYYATYVSSAWTVAARTSFDASNSLTNSGGWSASGTDSITYGSSLPNPTTVLVQSDNTSMEPVVAFTVTDGSLVLNTIVPGTYTITLSAFPYITKTITVTAS